MSIKCNAPHTYTNVVHLYMLPHDTDLDQKKKYT